MDQDAEHGDSGLNQMHDALLDEDEEKQIVLPDTENQGEFRPPPPPQRADDQMDEYDDSEDETEAVDSSPQRSVMEFLMRDEQSGAAIIGFLFMICAVISIIGFRVTPEGSNRFIPAIGATSIWTVIALFYIFYDKLYIRQLYQF